MIHVEEDYDRKVLFFTLKNSTSLIQHKHINLLQSAIFFLLAQVTVLLYIKWSLIENSFSSCSMEFPYYKYSADDARLLYNDNLVQEQQHWTCRHYLSILSSLFPVCVTDITNFLVIVTTKLKNVFVFRTSTIASLPIILFELQVYAEYGSNFSLTDA